MRIVLLFIVVFFFEIKNLLLGSLIMDFVDFFDCCIKLLLVFYVVWMYVDYVDNNGEDDVDVVFYVEI